MDFDVETYISNERLNYESNITTELKSVQTRVSELERKRKDSVQHENKLKASLRELEQDECEKKVSLKQLEESLLEIGYSLKLKQKEISSEAEERTEIKCELENLKEKRKNLEQDREESPVKIKIEIRNSFSVYLKEKWQGITEFNDESKKFTTIQMDKVKVEGDKLLKAYSESYHNLKLAGCGDGILSQMEKKICEQAPLYFEPLPDSEIMLPLYYKLVGKDACIYFPVDLDFENSEISVQMFYDLVVFFEKCNSSSLVKHKDEPFCLNTRLDNSDMLSSEDLTINLKEGRTVQFLFTNIDCLPNDVIRSL